MRKFFGNFIWWSLRKADTDHRISKGDGWYYYANLDEAFEKMAEELAHAITNIEDLKNKLHTQDNVIAVMKAEIQHLRQLYTPTTLAITAKSAPRSPSKPRRGGKIVKRS